ncbi:response regulator [Candidatus Omnitrophota bacterium]
MLTWDDFSLDEQNFLIDLFNAFHSSIAKDLKVSLTQEISLSSPELSSASLNNIRNAFNDAFIHIAAYLGGQHKGKINIFIPTRIAKAMCGFLLMEPFATVKENSQDGIHEDDIEIFKEIANQICIAIEKTLKKKISPNVTLNFEYAGLFDFRDSSTEITTLFAEVEMATIRSNLVLSELLPSFFAYILSFDTLRSLCEQHFGKDEWQRKEALRNSNSKRILIVDRDEGMRGTLKNYFSETDYICYEADNGSEALSALRKYPIDLIIVEFDMEGMSGIQVAQRIRANPNIKNVGIIFSSQTSTKENIRLAINNGGKDFWVRPVEREFALEQVAKFFNS